MKANTKTLWFFASFLCLILCALLYFNTHAEQIMAARGDYYFHKNDAPKAIKYYEAAFDAGLNDRERRLNYVNLLITSPMSAESQEKLVNFLKYNINDEASLKVEYFLYDIKKEIFKKYPGNYIRQATHNSKIIRWAKLPITYKFINSENAPDYFKTEIINAFSDLEKITGHLILFEESEKDANIVIRFNELNTSADINKKYIVAYTTPIISPDNILTKMDIKFYLKSPDNEYFSKNQVYNTALHEIIHALGCMGHSNDKEDIMYISKDSMSVMNDSIQELTDADINTVKLLYNIKPDITNADELKSEYIPYVALGNNTEVTNAKIREAKFYIKNAPNLSGGYIDLASGYVAAKDYAKAIKALEKALQVVENNETLGIIYYNLAVAYYYINDFEIAEDYLNKSISIKNSEEKQLLLADIYTRENKIQKAISEYKKLIKQHPQNIDYTIALTNIYIREKKYFDARNILKEYYKNNPNDKNNPRFSPYGIIKLGL